MTDVNILIGRYKKVRSTTEKICEPLATEDYVVQPMADVSPPKWHLAHTTWFFETFILSAFKNDYRVFDKDFSYFFNSYYESVGKRVIRVNRGNMTRPVTSEIMKYRAYVDQQMDDFLENFPLTDQLQYIFETGLQHEQQHQELLMTDIKFILGGNPLFPVYKKNELKSLQNPATIKPIAMEGGVYEVGYRGKGFHFDNERGCHKVYLHDFEIMDGLVTNEQYIEFIEAGGYKNFKYWLADGWDWVNKNQIEAPLYWHKIDGKWYHFTLNGLEEVNPDSPVTHVSQYEADAYASFRDMRLPTEEEWETTARKFHSEIPDGNFFDKGFYHPNPKNGSDQLFGDAWEWTGSAYLQYPYFVKEEGALGEYNGKFMSGQMVLRGASCATSADHIRHSYRNFFYPQSRWQFTGIRLARNI